MLIYYNVRPLTPELIAEAFPVVAFVDEEVTVQQWRDYASSVIAKNRDDGADGIMTLQDPQNHIIGISVYHIRPDLLRGRVLVIENFAVVALIGAREAAAKLLTAMEELARDRDCSCLAVSLLDRKTRRSPHHRHNHTGQFFKSAGFRLELARLGKCFDLSGQPPFDAAENKARREGAGTRP